VNRKSWRCREPRWWGVVFTASTLMFLASPPAGATDAAVPHSDPQSDKERSGLLQQVKGAVQDTLHSGVGWLAGGKSEPLVLQQGGASYLANWLHGRKTASGERYDMNELTAAHKTLPFGTRVIVRSLQTGREVAVRIVDRGPHLKDRIIDLSHAAVVALGIKGDGVSQVQIVDSAAQKALPVSKVPMAANGHAAVQGQTHDKPQQNKARHQPSVSQNKPSHAKGHPTPLSAGAKNSAGKVNAKAAASHKTNKSLGGASKSSTQSAVPSKSAKTPATKSSTSLSSAHKSKK
jgi:rare lipoprotein A